jgi:hypothetical protein
MQNIYIFYTVTQQEEHMARKMTPAQTREHEQKLARLRKLFAEDNKAMQVRRESDREKRNAEWQKAVSGQSFRFSL